MIIVIGAGITGLVIAERYATIKNEKVLVIEKRNHIGGNCFDFVNDIDLLVPLYGPHFFHTNSKVVWDYLSEFTEWHHYEHKVLSSVNGHLVPMPVNINTINILFGEKLTCEADMKAWINKKKVFIENPKNGEEAVISRMGRELYDLLFKQYTKKQWDISPHELDAAVLNRIPLRYNFDDRYFSDSYQAMPKSGYTEMLKHLMDHPNIEILLEQDYFDISEKLPEYKKMFFTGMLDRFFNTEVEGKLSYRSLHFDFQNIDKEWYQDVATVNYPNDYDFTRITEPKRSTGQKSAKTTIIREYPTWDGEPYYPVLNNSNVNLLKKYNLVAKDMEKKGIFLVGRLGRYRYLNMDQAVFEALELFNQLERE